MLGNQSFQRGFKPKFSGEVKKVDSVEGGVVISGGKRYEIARVLPVSKDRQVEIPKALAQGSEARTAKQADELAAFKAPLKEFLKDGPKGMAAVGTFLKSRPGFETKLAELRLNRPGGLRVALEGIGKDFEVSAGRGQLTVRLKRTRLVGKQRG